MSQQKTKEPIDVEVLESIIIPNIDKNVPIPQNKKDAKIDLTTSEELNIRANTIKELSDITGESIEPSAENRQQAEDIAQEMMKDPKKKVEFGNYPNETMAYLAGMVAQTNCMIVEDLADLKLHVVNGLVQLANTAENDKDKLAAFKAIGDVDGVDAFKKKTEVTHIHKSDQEVEDELRATIEQLKGKIIEGEVIESNTDE